ncbi:DNA polymerase alpha/epsilon subunit B-domain-containing protein [Irpex rosettiformis]|uniref:DNA polymerase alpha/epsilon subunit B-domain-containing protein n=1 Tax=Irpex rosettiformis TaxID=378272 RepID=A0ACB8TX85_9APHY|nr:DNA polymerase alpha/epsilon subunit B-domain-containing protein [Irpex rosettiformis]
MDQAKLSAAKEELRARFGAALEDDLLQQCAEFCKNNNINGDDLYFKWEALTYNTHSTAARVLDQAALQAIKEGVEREAAKVKAQRAQMKTNLSGLLTRNLGGIGRIGMKSTTGGPLKAQSMPVKLESNVRRMAGSSSVKIENGKEFIPRCYRYMYEKILDRSEALDDRIDEFAEIVKNHYGISELGDPGASTEEEVTVVGRITFDPDSSSSEPIKLNEATLTLESSRAMGSGVRVPLHFDTNTRVQGAMKGEGGVGLFPGAIVALKGRNGGGGLFVVSEILTLPPLSSEPPKPSGEAFSACIACGPFSSDMDFEYGPWQAALNKIATEKPDVIFLVGPFVDNTHPWFKEGNVDDTPTDLFRKKFLDPLSQLLDSIPGATALLVPSMKDVMSSHAIFPQSELDSSLVGDSRIHMLPNPCHVTINGVTFAASSVDVLFHLRKEEYFRRMSEIHSVESEVKAPGTDTMARLCRHVMSQRSFYPIFPVPQDVLHEVNLNISHSEALKLGGAAIDFKPLSVLVLPSKLKHFTKIIDDTTVINPSYTSKGIIISLKFNPIDMGQLVSTCITTQIIRCD